MLIRHRGSLLDMARDRLWVEKMHLDQPIIEKRTGDLSISASNKL
jgi:hypothetical protein